MDEAHWSPARPPRPTPYGHDQHERELRGRGPDGQEPRQDDEPAVRPDGGAAAARPGTRPVRRGRIAAAWLRISAGRRILVSYLALGLSIALVAGLGAQLQPIYGAGSPWQGIEVDDLRSTPQTDSWAVDLAATVAPGAPSECVRFRGTDVAQGLTVVRAEAAYTFGFAADGVCSSVPSGFRSRIALLDTDTGSVRWVHDTSADLAPRSSSEGTQDAGGDQADDDGGGTDSPSADDSDDDGGYPLEQSPGDGVVISSDSLTDGGRAILVQAGTGTRRVVETLSLATGRVLQSTGTREWGPEDRFATAGDVVATGRRSDDLLSYVYELRDTRDLTRVVWSGQGDATSTMIALPDRLLLGGDGTRQIPLATGVSSKWGSEVDTTLGYAVRGSTVFAARPAKGRGSFGAYGPSAADAAGFEAVSKTGETLWRSSLDLRGSYSLTKSCLAVTNRAGDRLTCLDYATGERLWTADVGTFSYAGGAVGQRSDDVYAVSTTRVPAVRAIDGRTGRERFQAEVPSGAYLVAAGRTVGYVLAYGVSGSRSTVIALDLSSGRRLWVHASAQQLTLWGGHLVDIGVDGLARRLSD